MNDQKNVTLSKRSLSPYEARVELATCALLTHFELAEGEARSMAKHVLRAVDTIPERIR
jgi:hypothetical protein